MQIIIVTGTPCTGKTTYAKELAKSKKYEYIDVNKLLKEHKLKEYYDKKRMCYVVDTEKLNKVLIDLINKFKKKKTSIVIDSHLSHFLPKKYVDLCFVIKCNLKKLKKRLQKRHYSKAKIEENLQAEIFDVCLTEAQEMGHKIKVIDTSTK
jgi:adenylate kinase